jgi:heme/copper-type cytochrome/quinol oxidase subunit 2
VNFSHNKNPIVYKYLNHGTTIELIWTTAPAIVLIAIAFPSFKLLYLMDSPLILNNFELVQNISFISVKYLKSDCKISS